MRESDEPLHRQAWELIPWVVNGSASEEQRRTLEQHVAACADCRDELNFQTGMRAAMVAAPAAERDPEPSLRRLWARIDGDEQEPPLRAVAGGRRAAPPALLRGLLLAVVVEAVGLCALSLALMQNRAAPAAEASYRTLSAPAAPAPGATIRLVPAPALSLGELQALLAPLRLQVVAGPSEAGVYALAPLDAQDAAATAQALQRLRADPGVRLAEPITPRS